MVVVFCRHMTSDSTFCFNHSCAPHKQIVFLILQKKLTNCLKECNLVNAINKTDNLQMIFL